MERLLPPPTEAQIHVKVGRKSVLERLHKPVRAILGGAMMFGASEGVAPLQIHAQENLQGNELYLASTPSLAQGLADLGLTLDDNPQAFQKTAANILGDNQEDSPPIIASLPSDVLSSPSDVNPPAPEAAPNPARQRIYNNLQDLVTKDRFCSDDGRLCNWNDFQGDIDANEVEVFGNSPDQTVFNTFRVLPNAEGYPVLTVLTGGQQGLKPEFGNIQTLETIVQRLNQIDPSMMDLLTNQYGVRYFTGSVDIFLIKDSNFTYNAGFTRTSKAIHLNELIPNPHRSSMVMLGTLIMEGNAIGWENAEDRSENSGIFKAVRFMSWVDKYKKSFSDQEYKTLINIGKTQVAFYTQNPQFGV